MKLFNLERFGERVPCMASWPMMNNPVCTNVLNKTRGINVEIGSKSRFNERHPTSEMSQIAVITAANTNPRSRC